MPCMHKREENVCDRIDAKAEKVHAFLDRKIKNKKNQTLTRDAFTPKSKLVKKKRKEKRNGTC